MNNIIFFLLLVSSVVPISGENLENNSVLDFIQNTETLDKLAATNMIRSYHTREITFKDNIDLKRFFDIVETYGSEERNYVLIEFFGDKGNDYIARLYGDKYIVEFTRYHGTTMSRNASLMFQNLYGTMSLICDDGRHYIDPNLGVDPFRFMVCTVGSKGEIKRSVFVYPLKAIPRNQAEREALLKASEDERKAHLAGMNLVFLAFTQKMMGDRFLADTITLHDDSLVRHLIGNKEFMIINLIKNNPDTDLDQMMLELSRYQRERVDR